MLTVEAILKPNPRMLYPPFSLRGRTGRRSTRRWFVESESHERRQRKGQLIERFRVTAKPSTWKAWAVDVWFQMKYGRSARKLAAARKAAREGLDRGSHFLQFIRAFDAACHRARVKPKDRCRHRSKRARRTLHRGLWRTRPRPKISLEIERFRILDSFFDLIAINHLVESEYRDIARSIATRDGLRKEADRQRELIRITLDQIRQAKPPSLSRGAESGSDPPGIHATAGGQAGEFIPLC